MPSLAKYLQEKFKKQCPKGWVCISEKKVVSHSIERLLGYAPQADMMLENEYTGERIWIELEVSRADPVANHAKFSTAHLVEPLPQNNIFVSMVSRHVQRGRGNLAAYAIGLMRTVGIRAFQTPLLPAHNGDEIKHLNHLPHSELKKIELGEKKELNRAISVAGKVGQAHEIDIHFAANVVEVIYNIYRWNQDIADEEKAQHWQRRRIQYFVFNSKSKLFAPSKFAAYVKLATGKQNSFPHLNGLTGMSLASYSEIDNHYPIFDGNRAWKHLEENLYFSKLLLKDTDKETQESFWKWSGGLEHCIQINSAETVILIPPDWAY